MIRKLKRLALAALAALALAVFAAPAAQAEALFTVPSAGALTETTLTMLPDGIEHEAHWTVDIYNAAKTSTLTVTCKDVRANSFEHDGATKGKEFADFTIVTPLFSGCTVNGIAVTAKNLGCGFTFTSGGQMDIVSFGIHKCEHTKEPIVFSGGGCTVEIGAQQITGVEYTTVVDAETGKKVVTADFEGVEKLVYEASGFLCPFGTTSNGNITHARALLKADEKAFGQPVDFIWEP